MVDHKLGFKIGILCGIPAHSTLTECLNLDDGSLERWSSCGQ